jgi:hypothetical protein
MTIPSNDKSKIFGKIYPANKQGETKRTALGCFAALKVFFRFFVCCRCHLSGWRQKARQKGHFSAGLPDGLFSNQNSNSE